MLTCVIPMVWISTFGGRASIRSEAENCHRRNSFPLLNDWMVETYFVTPKPNKKIREAFNLSDHVSSLLSFCLDKPANKKYLLFISRFVVQHLFFKIALINPNGITNGSFHVISVFRSLTSLSFHHEISSSRPLYPQGSYISSGHIRKQECGH